MTSTFIKNISIIGSLIGYIGVLSGCALLPSKLQSTQLSEQEVRSLFTEKTVISQNVKTGTISASYYSKDGKVRQYRKGKLRTGEWRVKNNGQKCMQMQAKKESCRIVKLEKDGVYRKYKTDLLALAPAVVYHSFIAENTLRSDTSKPQKAVRAKYENIALQQYLARKGFSPGPADGIWGPRSRQALQRYQVAHDLPTDSQPNRKIIKRMKNM